MSNLCGLGINRHLSTGEAVEMLGLGAVNLVGDLFCLNYGRLCRVNRVTVAVYDECCTKVCGHFAVRKTCRVNIGVVGYYLNVNNEFSAVEVTVIASAVCRNVVSIKIKARNRKRLSAYGSGNARCRIGCAPSACRLVRNRECYAVCPVRNGEIFRNRVNNSRLRAEFYGREVDFT